MEGRDFLARLTGENNEEAQAQLTQTITDELAKLSNSEINEEEQNKLFEKLLKLMSIFDGDQTENIINILTSKISKCLEADFILPSYLDKDYEIDPESFALGIFFNKFMQADGKPEDAAISIAFAPFASIAIESGLDAEIFTVKHAQKLLRGERIQQIAGCYLFRRLARLFAEEPTYAPKPLFKTMSALFISSDSHVRFAAHKLMRSMIDNGVFVNKSTVNVIIGQYKEYTEETLPLFFKLLQRFLDDNETVSIEVVHPIFVFAAEHLEERKADCLDLLTSVALVNAHYVEDGLDRFIDTAKSLAKSAPASSAGFIASIISLGSRPEYAEIETDLTSAIDSSIGRKKALELAESVATIYENESSIEKVTAFVLNFENLIGTELYYYVSTVLALLPRLKPSSEPATALFHKMMKILIDSDDSAKANAVCKVLKKLVKHYGIASSDAVAALDQLSNLRLLGGAPLVSFADSETRVFHFAAAAVDAFPECAPFARSIIAKLGEAASAMYPALLEPVGAALKYLSDEEAAQLSTALVAAFDDLTEADQLEVASICELWGKTSARAGFDRKLVFGSVARFLSADDAPAGSPAYAKCLTLLLELRGDGNEIPGELAKALRDIFPIPVDDGNFNVNEELLLAITKMDAPCEDLVAIAVEAAVMKKTETDAARLSKATVDTTKAFVVDRLKANADLKKAMQKEIGNARAKLNRFNALFK